MFSPDELIQEALSLDPLPATANRLTRILADDDWSLEEVAKTAALDQALTGKLLRHANSAASGSSQEITSVSTAVMRMGPGMVLSIALGEGLQGSLKPALPAYGMEEGALWLHSIASALAIEVLRKAGWKPPPGTFVAALVHDVGKLVIGRKLNGMGIKLTSGDSEESWVQGEAEQLGIDHAELGGAIARAWKLPTGVAEAVEHHHSPHKLAEGPTRMMAQLVAAADGIAHAIQDDPDRPTDPVAMTRLRLTPADQGKIREATANLVDSVIRLY